MVAIFSARSGGSTRSSHYAAAKYKGTFNTLVTMLCSGRLLHVDETKVAIKGSRRSADVWVFARPDTAVYVYHPTRDGETVRKTLQGFRGVLISDFYSAYDSVECPQQKCLIHLMRDLNDDLLRRPFDEELKDQASRFAALLQAVVATIDRFGLRNYHLRKHKPDVDRFYLAVSGTVYKSERARHYQRRLVKYRDKLFTFLDHDEVPWNNNNAENAVKRFVSRRKAIGTPFTESGIRDYLVLLSVYQTLRYRNLSFWQFIFSGETDIDAFAAKHH